MITEKQKVVVLCSGGMDLIRWQNACFLF